MLSFFDISVKNLVRWSAFLAFFEILAFIRYFSLDEPITQICPMLGPDPDPSMIKAYYLAIGVLAYVRIAFCIRPANAGIAKFAFQLHTLEIVPVTILYWLNVVSTIKSVDDFSTNPRLLPTIFIYFVILANAAVFWRFYVRVSEGVVVSRGGSVVRVRNNNNSISVVRENSVDASVVVSPPMVSAASKKKKATPSKKKIA